MNNSGTPTGESGRKELKVNKSVDADKLLDKYFEDLEKEGYGKIQVRALAFDVPEVSIKAKGGDENEEHNGLSDIINVLTSGKRTMELEEIANGARTSARLADLAKVKAKTSKLKKQRTERKEEKSAGGTAEPDNSKESR